MRKTLTAIAFAIALMHPTGWSAAATAVPGDRFNIASMCSLEVAMEMYLAVEAGNHAGSQLVARQAFHAGECHRTPPMKVELTSWLTKPVTVTGPNGEKRTFAVAEFQLPNSRVRGYSFLNYDIPESYITRRPGRDA